MKKISKIILPLACLTAVDFVVSPLVMEHGIMTAVAEAGTQSSIVIQDGTRRLDFDAGWRFQLGDSQGAQEEAFDDSSWRSLDLPHDWSIELPFNKKSLAGNGGGFLDGGTGWYRKTFTLPETAAGKQVLIDFDGVYMNSEVWINGHYLGKHPYGYTSFQYDMTPYLQQGGLPNVIAVKVNNNQPTSRWYSGSGIYRNVWLQVLDPVHIGQWGTAISTPSITENADKSYNAAVAVSSAIVNGASTTKNVSLTLSIMDSNQQVLQEETKEQTIEGGHTGLFQQQMDLAQAQLWSIDKPVLYTLKSEVKVDGKVVDTSCTPFGVRSFHFDPDTGFSLNGKAMKLHGVCLHHDEGSLGAAVNKRAIERELQIMKDMGVNAIRTSHNPPAPELLDLTDQMGFVVMDESFDCWETGKSKNDYSLYFRDWSERDVKSMVERDCNHPSIILWSIGNEIPNRTQATAQRLKKWVQEIDTTRPVTMANAGGNSDTAVADELGAVGYNYYEKAYDADHKAHPDWVIFGSETSSAVRTRGVYHLPTDKNILEAPDLQCSCYDNSVVPWGKSAEQSWIDDRDRPFVAGQFIWTGFDYIGEPTPYGDNAKSSYFGIVDTCGFPKDIYYFYRSQWTDTPTVHLLPEWNGHQAGDKVPVWAYTNAHTVDLYLNGKSLGSKTYDPMGKKLHLEWEVPYDQGELKAVASDAQGKVIATDVVRTTGKPAAIVLKPDRSVIHKDGKDLSYVEVDVVDKDGNIVPDADDLIEFTVIGGKIAGVDNGNPISFESYKGHTRKAFHGKCLLVVQSGTDCSEITVAAETNGGKLSATPIHIKAE